MYLLYLDESGTVKNLQETHYVVAGVSVFERKTYWIAKELEELAEEYARQIDIPRWDLEFHASEMKRGGRKSLWKAIQKPQRIEAIKRVLHVFADADDAITAFACAVHKPCFPARDAYDIAFEDICSRFDMQLKRLHHCGNTQRGLLILDNTHLKPELRTLANEFISKGTQWGVVRNFAESPLFMDSKASRLLQLADHVAYAVFRRYEYGDTSLLDIIAHKFDSDDKRMHGLSHKQLSLINCRCNSCAVKQI